jgi:gamma-glutamyl hercynylcysteine S-oxide synthase
MQEKQANSEIQVKFKPIYGIRAGVYLTFLYSFILFLILFFLLLYPGLKNHGAVLIVKTEPDGAAVRIDGVYRGVAGSKISVSKGNHTIEAVMPGFNSESVVQKIPARYFGSLFFPLYKKVEFTLSISDPVTHIADPASVFALYAADYAEWTFAGEPTASWQIPMSLSEGAYRVGNVPRNNETSYLKNTHYEKLQQVLLAASGFAVTRAAMRDLIRAKILLDNKGNAPSPIALVNSISGMLLFLSESQDTAKWLSQVLPREQAAIIESSGWFKKQSEIPPKPKTYEPWVGRTMEFAGIKFIYFYSIYPHLDNHFYISENPISRSLFETFLNEQPQWREHKTDYFPDEISSYPWDIDKNVITGVTWYAAQSFCEWMSQRYSPYDTEIRLPTEEELLSASDSINKIKNMGWEWCYDPYVPLQIAADTPQDADAPHEAKYAVGSPERSLRGRQTPTSTETRASLPPDLSSPIVTFRVVLGPKIIK